MPPTIPLSRLRYQFTQCLECHMYTSLPCARVGSITIISQPASQPSQHPFLAALATPRNHGMQSRRLTFRGLDPSHILLLTLMRHYSTLTSRTHIHLKSTHWQLLLLIERRSLNSIFSVQPLISKILTHFELRASLLYTIYDYTRKTASDLYPPYTSMPSSSLHKRMLCIRLEW